MKFTINKSSPGERIHITRPAQVASGLYGELSLEINALDGANAVVITKAEMTAMDAVKLIESLSTLATDMISGLREICGSCDGCGYCDHIDLDDETIRLPRHVLEDAGLPANCKFTAEVVDDGIITVSPAGHDFDLTDVPPDLLDMFRKSGVCIHELEDLLIEDGVIYGGDAVEEDGCKY